MRDIVDTSMPPYLGRHFLKGRGTDAQLATNIWNAYANFNAFDGVQDLAVTDL